MDLTISKINFLILIGISLDNIEIKKVESRKSKKNRHIQTKIKIQNKFNSKKWF